VIQKEAPAGCDGQGVKAEFKRRHALYSAQPSKSQVQAPRRGGKASRQKGDRAERAIVHYLQDRGFAAERVPLSGSAGGSYTGDLTVPLLGVDRVVEAKVRASGFRELYRWLETRDALVVKADRREPLVIVRLSLAAEVMRAAERIGTCPHQAGERAEAAPVTSLKNSERRSPIAEIKTATGRLSADQRALHNVFVALGVPCAVVRSLDDVLKALKAWNVPMRALR
jgi:Holliday junction resolvase